MVSIFIFSKINHNLNKSYIKINKMTFMLEVFIRKKFISPIGLIYVSLHNIYTNILRSYLSKQTLLTAKNLPKTD